MLGGGIPYPVYPPTHPGGYPHPVYTPPCTSLGTPAGPCTAPQPQSVHRPGCRMCSFDKGSKGARIPSEKGVKEAKTEVSGRKMPLHGAIP